MYLYIYNVLSVYMMLFMNLINNLFKPNIGLIFMIC